MREGELPMDHRLKSDPVTFEQLLRGIKSAEIRVNDRDYRIGDTLILMETRHSADEMKRGAPLLFTGQVLSRNISHVQSGYGLPDGIVMLSFERLRRRDDMASATVADIGQLMERHQISVKWRNEDRGIWGSDCPSRCRTYIVHGYGNTVQDAVLDVLRRALL